MNLHSLLLSENTYISPLFLSIYFFWERLRGGVEGWRERERERILKRLQAQHRAWHRAWSHHPEIMTWAEIKSWTVNQLSHPDGLISPLFLKDILAGYRILFLTVFFSFSTFIILVHWLLTSIIYDEKSTKFQIIITL